MATSFNIGGGSTRARRAVSSLFFALSGLFSASIGAPTNQIAATAKPDFEGPRLVIAEKEREFGTVTRGEVLEATFALKNIGSEPLKVLNVKPG